MKIEKSCKECNKSYIAETREIKRGNGMFCSMKCSGAFRSKSTKPKIPNSLCAFCKTEIYVRPYRLKNSLSGIFYCSREHQIQGVKTGLHKSGPQQTKRFMCLRNEQYNCNTKTKRKTKICKPCEIKDNISDWLSGNIEITWIGSSREPKTFVKKYLLENRGDRCEVCFYDKKRPDGTSKIQMDHIDGNYMNNHIENLRLLCPNCHEDTPTMGSKNKNGGRRYRLSKIK